MGFTYNRWFDVENHQFLSRVSCITGGAHQISEPSTVFGVSFIEEGL